ncbi:cell division protein FtsQ/DivIB [Sediminibacterium goheungense]|uniref:Cell division protein FtsQ n=1 Tax=Sediminibacterium goheungense TaxID=1086393 RepID=A0A4R6IW97_9BACT|nr:FtsQ-type POTRA domain-containing protein [Sediminibacterium goheungense]TDO26969.1 cell division protein FtsQ [Sediminibacterium goheungense]
MNKIPWKKRLIQTAWILAGIGTVVLMGAAMQKKNRKTCSDVKIEISGIEEHMFIDEKDILELVNQQRKVIGTPISLINLRAMESALEKNPWVKNAEMYLDNQQVLQIQIEERQPVARIFTMQGGSFYLDSAGVRLPLSEKLSARVPMFTGFPSDNVKLSKPDSLLLKDVVKLGMYILEDSFWAAQVAQIDIEPGREFELIPVFGDHVVSIGKADDLDAKFNRLYTFYKQAWLQHGIHYYEKIDVQFDKQVVAVRKGMGAIKQDSTAALALIRQMTIPVDDVTASVPEKLVRIDSSTKPVAVVQKSVKETPPVKTVINNNNKINTKPLSKKAEQKKEETTTKPKPKAVMKKSK